MQHLLQKLGHPPCDVLIVGDGSGTGWEDGCGYSCVLIDLRQRTRVLLYGGAKPAPITYAELAPYIHAFMWHNKCMRQDRSIQNTIVVTDSQYVATAANNVAADIHDDELMMATQMLAAARRLGYAFSFIWQPRIDNGGNYISDLIAGMCRREIMAAADVQASPYQSVATRARHAIERFRPYNPVTGLPITSESCLIFDQQCNG